MGKFEKAYLFNNSQFRMLKTQLEKNGAPGRATTGTNFTQKVPIRFEPIMLTTQLHGAPIDPPIF